MNEPEIATLALANLQKTTHIKGKWRTIALKGKETEIDGQIDLAHEGNLIKLNAEVKNNLRTIHLPQIYALAKKAAPLMVIANHIFPKIKEELRRHNIAYLEGNGNVWLKFGKNLIWIETNKTLPEEKEKINRAFTKTGLKVVYDIFRDETLINAPYREIANRADIALGNVNYILNGLKEKGFLLRKNKDENLLINKKELLNTWMVKYAEKLQPELEIGRYKFLKPDDFINWRDIQLKPGKTCWGGEPAGQLLTNYLKPGVLTLYTTETRVELMKNYKLIPDPKGYVIAYKKFWNHDNANFEAVDPILVYTDLMNTGDHRCIETAQKIYNDILKGKF
ncbi:MAG: type IV toxin-antitoxin system AbiEi family antitoxin [bacterium]|nr:type IV toxin-antitoxin system AbiEi family antitoxin [bacterium]